MDLLFGSVNLTKQGFLREILRDLPVRFVTPQDLGIGLRIVEDGHTAEENARKKAVGYCRASGLPTFSMDSGLYIDKFPPDRQPGLQVRRAPRTDGDVSDDELLEFFVRELEAVGGSSGAIWVDAIAVALDEDRVGSRTFERRTLFMSRPSNVRLPHAPLSSLQVDMRTGRYISELTFGERMGMQAEETRQWREFIWEQLIELQRKSP